MSHTYCSSLFHCVFSTKERRKTITLDVQPQLWAFMGGIVRNHKMTALAIGGTEDHVHLLLSLPSTLSLSQAVGVIKSVSSQWVHGTLAIKGFEWQEGYGAFSIGQSQLSPTIAYISRQAEHHRKRDFCAEFLAILKKHRIEYDPRYVWG